MIITWLITALALFSAPFHEAEEMLVAGPDRQEDTTERAVIRPVIGISTNLPYDITYIPGYGLTSIPSFSLEFYPAKGKFTFGADVEWPMWRHPENHRYMQVNNLTSGPGIISNPARIGSGASMCWAM